MTFDPHRWPPNYRTPHLLIEVVQNADENGALANATADELRDALALAADMLRTHGISGEVCRVCDGPLSEGPAVYLISNGYVYWHDTSRCDRCDMTVEQGISHYGGHLTDWQARAKERTH